MLHIDEEIKLKFDEWIFLHYRTNQMSGQGHNTSPGKPYEEVGKPLYLSSKAMVQGTLGQKSSIKERTYQHHERNRILSTDRKVSRFL